MTSAEDTWFSALRFHPASEWIGSYSYIGHVSFWGDTSRQRMSSERCDVCTGDMLVAHGAIFKKENRRTREPCTPRSMLAVVKELECCGISHFWLLCFERFRRFDFWSLILSLLRCLVTITVLYLVARTDGIGASGACSVAGRVVYVKRRLCGSELSRKGCENAAEICKSVSFFRLPGAKRQELRKVWCTKTPRTNTQQAQPRSPLCRIFTHRHCELQRLNKYFSRGRFN